MAKKQLRIAGTEPPQIKEVEAAAEAYQDAKKERVKLTDRETETREALLAVMLKHGLSVYKDESITPPLLVTVTEGEKKVDVKSLKADEGGDGEEGGDAVH